MAESRLTSVLAEVLSTGDQSQARVSSVAAEVLVSIAEEEPGSEVPVSTGSAVIVCVVSS